MSEYQELLARTPKELHALVEETFCAGFIAARKLQREIDNLEVDEEVQVLHQNDVAVHNEMHPSVRGTSETSKLLKEKYAEEKLRTEPHLWITRAMKIQRSLNALRERGDI